MSLIYAFHAQGIGTCCLNWSVDSTTDRRLRATTALPPNENVIMMLAIGQTADTVHVARSWRRPVTGTLKPGTVRGTAQPNRRTRR